MTLIEENEERYRMWKVGTETLAQALKTALGGGNEEEIADLRKALRAHLHTCSSVPMAKLDQLTLDHLQDLFDPS